MRYHSGNSEEALAVVRSWQSDKGFANVAHALGYSKATAYRILPRWNESGTCAPGQLVGGRRQQTVKWTPSDSQKRLECHQEFPKGSQRRAWD